MNFHQNSSKQQKSVVKQYMAHCEEKNSSSITGLFKNCCLKISKFSSGFSPFKHGKKNKFNEYFSARFWNSHFHVQKEKFSMNFPKNASK